MDTCASLISVERIFTEKEEILPVHNGAILFECLKGILEGMAYFIGNKRKQVVCHVAKRYMSMAHFKSFCSAPLQANLCDQMKLSQFPFRLLNDIPYILCRLIGWKNMIKLRNVFFLFNLSKIWFNQICIKLPPACFNMYRIHCWSCFVCEDNEAILEVQVNVYKLLGVNTFSTCIILN